MQTGYRVPYALRLESVRMRDAVAQIRPDDIALRDRRVQKKKNVEKLAAPFVSRTAVSYSHRVVPVVRGKEQQIHWLYRSSFSRLSARNQPARGGNPIGA